jgi:hypothetical protein
VADGPRPTGLCYLDAQIAGSARRTLQRALEQAGVRQQRMAGVSDPVWELDPRRNRKE